MDLILKYFPDLSPRQIEQFSMMFDLYVDWNSKINVISRSDLDNLYERHVLHSLALACCGVISSGDRVLDIGCGGGFPVVPLAVLMPDVEFTAIDSIGKKIRVVDQVASALELQNLTAVNGRAEVLTGQWDWITSRAVAPLSSLLEWSEGKYRRGLISLKGGDLQSEIENSGVVASEILISDWFEEDFFSTKKVVLIDKNLQRKKK